jgi:hypothetical protein
LECIIEVSVEKALLILATNVKWPSLESRVVWTVMSRGIPNHMYEVKHSLRNTPTAHVNGHSVEIYVNTK